MKGGGQGRECKEKERETLGRERDAKAGIVGKVDGKNCIEREGQV